MIHYNIETVMKEAEKDWEQMNIGKSPDAHGKCAFMLGWLKSRYTRVFNDLPDNRKFILKDKYKEGV